ncbi:MAG: SOS response-associated peptidase [Planctomycetota bacterium]|nr:MAG: SOS response-associated peptidase [Planctomycetota bacterium]
MCGRFTLRSTVKDISRLFQLRLFPEWTPRFNIAPSQSILCLDQKGDSRQPAWRRWGLIPAWSKDPSQALRMSNARAETVDRKPAYRQAFRQRRCLIPADGFFEWQKTPSGKQPWFFTLKETPLFAFAGLWERWTSPQGEVIESCTLLTTEANALMAPIHHRMPVILPLETVDLWLDSKHQERQALQACLQSYPAEAMEAFPVSPKMNSAKFEGPECIAPWQPPANLF